MNVAIVMAVGMGLQHRTNKLRIMSIFENKLAVNIIASLSIRDRDTKGKKEQC